VPHASVPLPVDDSLGLTMKIVDFLREELVVPELKATLKPDVLAELAAHLGEHQPGVEKDALVRVLLEREAMDGRPTHLFFVLVAPESSTGAHLKALARISRLFKDGDFRGRLLAAGSAAEMYKTIVDEDAKY